MFFGLPGTRADTVARKFASNVESDICQASTSIELKRELPSSFVNPSSSSFRSV